MDVEVSGIRKRVWIVVVMFSTDYWRIIKKQKNQLAYVHEIQIFLKFFLHLKNIIDDLLWAFQWKASRMSLRSIQYHVRNSHCLFHKIFCFKTFWGTTKKCENKNLT